MKAVISTTYSDTYLYFLPITTWCWNRLNVDVICFIPFPEWEDTEKMLLISNTMGNNGMGFSGHYFSASEHKEATYAQCLRNYGAAVDGLDENELLCTSDIDMICFRQPPYNDMLTVWGSDLVPQGQMPMCYITGTVKQWKEAFSIGGRTYQQCIDDLLGDDECKDYRGNRWSRDQELAHDYISKLNHSLVPRAREGTQWAKNRLDRDDSYILDRLNLSNEDYHMNRPGYEDKNFQIILTILQYHYPQEDFGWLVSYNEEYKKLL